MFLQSNRKGYVYSSPMRLHNQRPSAYSSNECLSLILAFGNMVKKDPPARGEAGGPAGGRLRGSPE